MMTVELADELRGITEVTDRCWAFNARPEVDGWTISRRSDYLHMRLGVNAQTADCQTFGYHYSGGDRAVYRVHHELCRYGRPDPSVPRVSKHTRIGAAQ
ncbi:hypothetical protein NKJ06_25940 [Mesorhizobium sp. M0293]|uniref:hypothetical protein n=1 Tax=Mesorhizobium sp. M0293 TaxID=2956930 RepID=UPI0033354FDC